MNGIVAYTFLIKYEKNQQFLSSIKRDAHKRILVPFFCLTVYDELRMGPSKAFLLNVRFSSFVQ